MRTFFQKYRGILGFSGLAALFLAAVVWANTTHTLDALRFLAGSVVGIACLLLLAGLLQLAIEQTRNWQAVKFRAKEATKREAQLQQNATHLAQEVEDWLRSDEERRQLYYGDPQRFEPPASQRKPGQPI